MISRPSPANRLEPLAWWSFLIGVALLPWAEWPPFPWLHPNAQWSDALFAIAIGALAVRAAALRRVAAGPLELAVLAWLLAGLTSFAFAPDALRAMGKVTGMAELGLLLLVTRALVRTAARRALLTRVVAISALTVFAAAVAGVGLYRAGIPTLLLGTQGDLVSGDYARVAAAMRHPNLLGSYCVFASAIVAGERRTGLRRVVQGALLVTVTLTISRAAVAFVLAAAWRRLDLTNARGRVAAVLCFGLAAVPLATLTFVDVRLDPTRPTAVHVGAHSPTRATFIVTAWDTARAYPLVGSGPGTSPAVWQRVAYDAHLTPLHVASTLGLPALAALVAVLAAAWRSRSRPVDQAVWTGLLALGLDGLTQDVEDFRHVWVLLGLGCAVRDNPGVRQ